MGGDTSKPLPPLPGDNYMCITTFDSDSMLLYYVSQSEIEAIRNSICETWRKGISSEEYICEEDKKNPKNKNCLKMKLNGRPWGNMTGEEQANDMEYMVAVVLDALHALGWKIIVISDLYESIDVCFWLFQRDEPNTYNSFSVGLSSENIITIMNTPPSIVSEIRKICEGEWGIGIELLETVGPTTKINLNGKPWNAKDQGEVVEARTLVAEIVKKMAGHQFDLFCSANVRGTTDTLLFKYNPSVVESDMASMQIVTPDTLYLVKFPDALCAAAKDVITEFWPKGIQSVGTTGHEFKLTGRPFDRQMDRAYQDSVYARRMVTKLFEKFASLGYMVQTGLSLSQSESQKANFLFRKIDPMEASFMCLSINREDSIQLVCAQEDVCHKVSNVIKIWEKGENGPSKLTPYDGCQWQTKLKGCPWSIFDFDTATDGIYGQALLLHVLAAVQNCGWDLVCCGDLLYKYDGQKYKADYPFDNCAWWFVYKGGTEQDMIVSNTNLQRASDVQRRSLTCEII